MTKIENKIGKLLRAEPHLTRVEAIAFVLKKREEKRIKKVSKFKQITKKMIVLNGGAFSPR